MGVETDAMKPLSPLARTMLGEHMRHASRDLRRERRPVLWPILCMLAGAVVALAIAWSVAP